MRLLPGRRTSPASRRGQTLVEFALVLPLLALLLVMAVDFGRVFFGWVSIHNAARVGASYAAGHFDAWNAPLGQLNKEEQRDAYTDAIQNDLQAINCAFGGVPDPDYTDANGNGRIDAGELVRVELECSFALITPLANSVMGGAVQLTGSSEFVAHAATQAALPPPPPPPPAPTCTVPLMEGQNRNTARGLWDGASFDPDNLIEDGSGNFLVDSQSQPPGTELPCATGTVTISEAGSTGPPPPTCQPPTADFVGSPLTGSGSVLVNFTDLSTSSGCPILSWQWAFNPGTSSDQNPSHTFVHTGNGQHTRFPVTLTVTNAAGSDTESKNNYVTVTRP